MEIIGEPMDADTMTYNLTTVVEERMEMGGVILLLAVLLRYMARPQDNSHVATDWLKHLLQGLGPR